MGLTYTIQFHFLKTSSSPLAFYSLLVLFHLDGSDRNQRFERITKDLKVTRVFTTLVEEMKAINGSAAKGDESHCTEVMVPMAHSERSPMLLLMGGGMGAGKSTVLKEILNE